MCKRATNQHSAMNSTAWTLNCSSMHLQECLYQKVTWMLQKICMHTHIEIALRERVGVTSI